MDGIRQITAVLQVVVLRVVLVPPLQVVLPLIHPPRSRLPPKLRQTRPVVPGVVVTKEVQILRTLG